MPRPSLLLLLLLLPLSARAQCERENKAFLPGETLTYDLYFQWHFVWVKAGAAHYSIRSTTYAGEPALRCDLLFEASKRLSRVFPMQDTLVSLATPHLQPLYFRKGATEGKHYTVDEVSYSYTPGNPAVRLHLQRLDRHGQRHERHVVSTDCNYDMLAILNVARSFDTANYTPGQRICFPMATGRRIEQQTLVYQGTKDWKANDGITYRCLVFSLLDSDEPKKEKELLRFYVTDDANHLPVRIDFYLRFGTAKAYYAGGTGIRHPQTAIVKQK